MRASETPAGPLLNHRYAGARQKGIQFLVVIYCFLFAGFVCHIGVWSAASCEHGIILLSTLT